MNENFQQDGQNENDTQNSGGREISVKVNICAILGFALSVITALTAIIMLVINKSGILLYCSPIPFVSLILSAIGTAQAKGNKISKALGITGIVLSVIMALIALGCLLLLILFIQACKDIEINPQF